MHEWGDSESELSPIVQDCGLRLPIASVGAGFARELANVRRIRIRK